MSTEEWLLYAVISPDAPSAALDALLTVAESYARERGGELGEEFVDDQEGLLVPWGHRPQAGRLLEYAAHPGCRARHVVTPEARAAFSVGDLLTAGVVLEHHGLDLHLVGAGRLDTRRLTDRNAAQMLQDSKPSSSPLADRAAHGKEGDVATEPGLPGLR